MTMRAIIVDDEDLARRGIRALLARAPDVEVVAECGNAREAIEAMRVDRPDLVFLDVEMPGKSGFDVIETIGASRCPYIVFVTAHDDFAIRAFDVHALDYLLKPLNEERFDMALERARKAMAGAQERSIGRRLARLAADLGRVTDHSTAAVSPDRIPVKTAGRVVVIRVADVDWVKAEHDYVSLYVGDKSWLVRETIASIESRFADAGLVRIHRSTLVNIDRVRELRPLDKGEFRVVLHNGTELKLSRNFRAALPRLAGAVV
jgi:two-component system, LytTR family, response regulator